MKSRLLFACFLGAYPQVKFPPFRKGGRGGIYRVNLRQIPLNPPLQRGILKTIIIYGQVIAFLLAAGCATPPNRKALKLPSQMIAPLQPQLPPEEKLKELIVPQREEAKKVPEKVYSFYARDAHPQEVLLAFSRESDLNIVIDPELDGKVTIDLKRVTLKEALNAILSQLGWAYRIDGKFIKIMRPQMETRIFTLNYITTKRSGRREIYASTGGGLQTGMLSGQQSVSTSGGRTGFSDLVSVDEMDLWKEVQKGLETILFGSFDDKVKGPSGPTQENGKTTFSKMDGKGKKLIINKLTGAIWVTDYSPNLSKVAAFLEMIEGSSQRQVTIQAKIMEVILSEEHKEGINWKVLQGLPRSANLSWGLTDKAGTTGFPGATPNIISGGATTLAAPGLFKLKPLGGIFSIGAAGNEVALSDVMQAISEQGQVKVLSSPTISTLNNQKAIIRVGNQDVFFITGAVSTQTTVTQTVQPMTIDIGIILDVTPQIAEDGTIIMNIHPSITEKTGEKVTPDGKTTFPLLSVRETDTTVRVKDGQTIIIAGLMQEKSEGTYIGVPGLKSVPLLGNFFRNKVETKRNSELVIMITPTLQVGRKAEDFAQR